MSRVLAIDPSPLCFDDQDDEVLVHLPAIRRSARIDLGRRLVRGYHDDYGGVRLEGHGI
jgi:hypothetical protein